MQCKSEKIGDIKFDGRLGKRIADSERFAGNSGVHTRVKTDDSSKARPCYTTLGAGIVTMA